MLVVMHFLLMHGVGVVMRPVIARVIVFMCMYLFPVIMGMHMRVQVLVVMFMFVFMLMHRFIMGMRM